MRRHVINGFSLLRQWIFCSCPWPATCQPTCLCESKTTDELTVLLFCYVYIDKGATLNLLQYLRVICRYRAVQTNSADTSTTGTAAYVAIVTIAQARPQYSLNHACTLYGMYEHSAACVSYLSHCTARYEPHPSDM